MTDRLPAQTVRPLRVLEIGAYEFFAAAVPEQTEFYWTGTEPWRRAPCSFGPIRMLKSLTKLRRGEFDLLVVHAPQYPPWHPRSILTALRDWNVRFPLALFAMFAWRFVHWFHDVPIAAVDLGDPCLIGRHNGFLLDHCRAFFKRELPSDHWLAFRNLWPANFPGRRWRSKPINRRRIEKLRPLSLGTYPLPQVALSPIKTADIFFAGEISGNSTVRIAGLKELQALGAEGYVVDVSTKRLSAAEFLRRMSAAWLAWSPAGLGWDCVRHYEAALVGTVPVMNDPTIMRHRPLRDGEHCVLYRIEPGGLAEAVRNALLDKARLQAMASAAAEHVRRHHNLYARAEYVASTVLGRRLDGSRLEASSS